MLSWISCIILDCAWAAPRHYISLSLSKKKNLRTPIDFTGTSYGPFSVHIKGLDCITRSVRSVISNSLTSPVHMYRSIESWRQVRSLDILPLRRTILQLNWILANQYCKQLGTEALPLPDLFSLVSVVLLLIVLQKRMAWGRSRGTQRGRLPPKFITKNFLGWSKVFLDLWKCILSGAIN